MKLNLTLACALYDRTLPLQGGLVVPEGIDLNFLTMEHHEMFRRQARHAEFDVSEFSLSTYTVMMARGDRRLVAIPVFPSRMFRHGYIYVNKDAGIREPKDLVGKRMGAMEYQQTAAVWMRILLQDEYGISPDQMEWYFGSYDRPGQYSERIPIELPANVRHRTIPSERSLDEMLESGEIDAAMGAVPLPAFVRRSPKVGRLFPNYRQAETDYYRRTGIFPIMHTVVVKRSVYEQHPWVAHSLFQGFARAKAMARHLLSRQGAAYTMLPWLWDDLENVRAALGDDPFPYGLGPNRAQLETFLRHNHEHGLLARPLTVDELFPPETAELVG
jgi:4,5-dihydroxyphthalate decarboxylase